MRRFRTPRTDRPQSSQAEHMKHFFEHDQPKILIEIAMDRNVKFRNLESWVKSNSDRSENSLGMKSTSNIHVRASNTCESDCIGVVA